jgi:RHS repeat-associated protein
MKGLRSLVVFMGFCLAGLAACSPAAFGEGFSLGEDSVVPTLRQSALVVPGMQLLAGGEQPGASGEGGGGNAMAVAAPGHGPEIPALRSRYSRTYEGVHGLADLVLSPQPVNYKDSAGRWQPIDDQLVPAGSLYANRADDYTARLPAELSGGAAGKISFLHGADSVGFTLLGASAAAQVNGASATYANALPSTDVRLTTTSGGLQELLTLKGPGAPRQFTYELTTGGGLHPLLSRSGEVELVDPHGGVRLHIPAPVASDARGSVGRASFGLSSGPDHRWTLVVNVDPAWLGNPRRAYPVTVDPTTTTLTEPQVCTLFAATPTTSRCHVESFLLKYRTITRSNLTTGVDSIRGLIEFPSSAVAQIPSDSEIAKARLVMLPYNDSEYSNTASEATVYNVKTAWDTTASWNTPKSGGAEWPGGTPYDTVGPSAILAQNPEKSSEKEADVTTLVRDWIGKKYGGFYGLGLSHTVNGLETEGTLSLAEPTLTITYAPITGERGQFRYDTQQLDDKMKLSVNTATGDLHLVNSDYLMPGPGISIDESRVYDSRRMSTPVDLSLGWKFSLARETTCAPACLGYSGIWDAPDGSVTGWGTTPAKAATGDAGFALGDGVDAVHVSGNACGGLNGDVMYNATGIAFNGTSLPKYCRRSLPHPEVHMTQGSSSCPTQGPTLTMVDWTGATAFTLTTNCVGQGQVTKMEDPTGRKWLYSYDTANRLHTYTDPGGGITTYEYDANNLLNKITTPAGNVTLITYDSTHLGRVVTVKRQDSHGTTLATTGYSYSQSGQSGPCQANELNTTETDPAGRVWQYCYDSHYRMTHFIDPNGHDRSSLTYGAFSHVHTTAAATGQEAPPYTNTLDPSTGVTTATSEPSNAQTTTAYSNTPTPYKPTLTTDGEGNHLRMIYDGFTEELQSVEALRGEIGEQPEELHLYWSPETGLLNESRLGKTPNEQTTKYKYDTRGNRTEITPPSPMQATKMTYDTLDRVATHTDGSGNQATYHYDNLDRVKEISYSNGSSVVYSYDGDGNIKEAIDPNGIATYKYDGMDRQTSSVYGGQTITQDYFADGQLKDITDAGGTVTYTYNKDAQLASVSDPATRTLTDPVTKQPAVVELHWDTDQTGGFPHGDLTEIDYPIGSGGKKTGNLQTVYGYDANDRIKTITSTANSTTLQSWKYSYVNAANGNLQTDLRQFIEGPAGQQTTYSYDYMNRLFKALTMDSTGKNQLYNYSYCYNSCGASHPASQEGFSNILQKIVQVGTNSPTTTDYQYNAANELTTQTGGSFTYDNTGNMTISPAFKMGFNVRDQLTELTLTGATPLAFGQQGATNDLLSTIGSTRLENNPLGVTASTALNGSGGTYFTRTPNGMLIDSRSPTGTNGAYYLQDDRGSVVRTVGQSGTPTQNPITYEPYGSPQGTPPASPPTFGFNGGYQSFTSGEHKSDLVHYGERYYNPSTGTWTQPDPASNPEDLLQANPFLFAADDPINQADPKGREAIAAMIAETFLEGMQWCYHHPWKVAHNDQVADVCQWYTGEYLHWEAKAKDGWISRCVGGALGGALFGALLGGPGGAAANGVRAGAAGGCAQGILELL